MFGFCAVKIVGVFAAKMRRAMALGTRKDSEGIRNLDPHPTLVDERRPLPIRERQRNDPGFLGFADSARDDRSEVTYDG
jgi:hypothetical protein